MQDLSKRNAWRYRAAHFYMRLQHLGAYPLQHSSCAQLEEKRIPYTIEKINMQCYGDKPAEFLAKVGGADASRFCQATWTGVCVLGQPWNGDKDPIVFQLSHCLLVIAAHALPIPSFPSPGPVWPPPSPRGGGQGVH